MREFRFIDAQLIEPYREYCLTTGSWTEHRFSCLISLDTYCRTNWPGARELTQEMVDGWCAKRPSEQVNTCVARARPARHFLRYLRERGRTELIDPEIPPMKPTTSVPHSFTDDELRAFFYTCDHAEFHQYNKRNCKNLKLTIPVFFRLLYSSGIRPTGARQLKRTDVDLETGVIYVRKTKGANQHYVVLHDSMRELMERYDKAMSFLYPDRKYFFPDQNGSFHPNYWVEVHFRKLWRQVSDTPAVPYAFRHHYAIFNINRWVHGGFAFYDKLVYLSKSMGHCDLEHTKYYYSLVPAMSDILEDLTAESFNNIVPEVAFHEES